MVLQSNCPNRCKAALVAFVRFFTWVSFQMCPQMASPNGCIVALVTFVQFFSRVRFQRHPQIVCSMRCIVTLVAFICPFSIFHRTIHSFRRSVHSEDKMLTAWLDFTKISHHWWVQICLFLNTWHVMKTMRKSITIDFLIVLIMCGYN